MDTTTTIISGTLYWRHQHADRQESEEISGTPEDILRALRALNEQSQPGDCCAPAFRGEDSSGRRIKGDWILDEGRWSIYYAGRGINAAVG